MSTELIGDFGQVCLELHVQNSRYRHFLSNPHFTKTSQHSRISVNCTHHRSIQQISLKFAVPQSLRSAHFDSNIHAFELRRISGHSWYPLTLDSVQKAQIFDFY